MLNKEVKIFISYSSNDVEFFNYFYDRLSKELDNSANYDIIIDKKNIKPGDVVTTTLKAKMSNVDILIPLLSTHSIKSEWVQFEIMSFLNRLNENLNLKIIPVILDDTSLPPYLSNISAIDCRNPNQFDEKISLLGKLIKNNIGYNLFNPKLFQNTLRKDAEEKRIERMIQSAVENSIGELKNKISAIVNTFHKQQYILSPESIAIREAEALEDIWVLTNHLYNDTEDADIKKSVQDNLKKGIHYTYFIVESALIKRRREKYEKLNSKWIDQYKFVVLPKGMVLPFDEIVLYEPLDIPRLWGYFQIKYPIMKKDDDLFLELSKSHRVGIAKDLERILENSN